MKMRAAVLERQGTPLEDVIKFQEIDIIEPRANEVRVKIVSSGVCHTDMAHSMNEWNMDIGVPMVLGHEGAGIVESVGPGVTKVKPGDHVVISIPSCGHCDMCTSGKEWFCEEVANLHLLTEGVDFYDTSPLSRDGEPIYFLFQQGAFAEYVCTNVNSVTKIDQDFDLKIAGPLGCGIRTGAGAVYNVLKPRPGDWVIITGSGPVGAAALMMARAMGAKTKDTCIKLRRNVCQIVSV